MITSLTKNGDGTYSSVALVADQPSEITGRIYPYDILEKTCNKFITDRSVIFGELDSDFTTMVAIDKISHQVTGICLDGNQLIVTISVLQKTPRGSMLQSFLDNNVALYLQLRALGSVGIDNRVDQLELITFDVVSKKNGS